MEIDVLNQLKQTVYAFGVNFHRYNEYSSIGEEKDRRIYKMLGVEHEFVKNITNAINVFKKGVLYIDTDCYDLANMSFMYEDAIISIGPFIVTSTEEILPFVMEKNHIPSIFHKELKEYYNSIPVVRDMDILEKLVMMHMRYLFDETVDISRTYIEHSIYDINTYDELQLLEGNRVSMETIAYRYKMEDRFMNAVSSGDVEKVYQIETEFLNYRISPRVASRTRNNQNYLIILNTLLRRAVQHADVHPAHIDHVSTDFANRIETTTNDTELRKLSKEMTRTYCMLVKKHSLEGHSEMVRDALNFIDFNLIEDLSLNAIADKLSANASYLSKQFKKEKGKTLTDYVNEKRVHTSLRYLATTDIPIQQVAELVGIYDENYFSRLFKKYQQITPSNYRTLMKNK